jgi:hypothetical protein
MGTMRGTLRLKAPLYKEWEEQYRGAAYTLSMAISVRRFKKKNAFRILLIGEIKPGSYV